MTTRRPGIPLMTAIRGRLVRSPRVALGVAFLCLAVFGAACSRASKPSSSAGGASAQGQGGQVTLRLGYFPNLTHATALAGVALGLFAKALGPNVKLETTTFNAGPAAVEALFSDALDASYMGPNPAINAYVRSKGEAVRIVAGAASGGAFLVVRPEVNAAADLRGKKVATPQLGGTQDVAARRWLQAQGLKTDAQGGGDVSVVPQDNADALTAFKTGQIAGAWVPEPWASRMVVEGSGKVLVDERDLWPGGQFVTTNLVVRSAFLKQHPDVIARLLQGQAEATAYLTSQPEAAQRTVNAALTRITGKPLAAEVIARAWQGIVFTNDPLPASLRKSADDAVALGFLKLGGLNLNGIYDLGPLNVALKAAGQSEIKTQ